MPEKEGGACEEGKMRIGDVVLDEREGGERHARRRMNVGAAGGGVGIGSVMDVSWRFR